MSGEHTDKKTGAILRGDAGKVIMPGLAGLFSYEVGFRFEFGTVAKKANNLGAEC
jgi:hypothetical protein